MALGLATLMILGLLTDYLLRRARVPGLVGMLGVGILLGPCALAVLHPDLLGISSDLRMIALIVILLRAGFELSTRTLRRVGMRAALLSCIPAVTEGAAVTALGPWLLGLGWLESAILGSVLAAVSPAVVVPFMIRLMEEKRGTDKGIPTLVLAASSIDDVFVIVIYSVLMGFYTGAKVNVAWKLAGIPLSIVSGILVGLVCGWALYRLFSRFNPRATKRLMIILALSTLLVTFEHATQAALPFASLLAVMALGTVILEKNEYMAHELSRKLAKLWVFAEILLFTLVGAQVDVQVAWQAGLAGTALVALALVARSAGTWICLLGSDLNRGERLFVVISYLPKATVQAAIGGGPLIAMRAAGMDTGPGEVILAVAVLSIVLTAPLGAWAIAFAGKRTLSLEAGMEPTLDDAAASEETLARDMRVEEAMDSDIIAVRETDTLAAVFHAFSESDFTVCPVLDSRNQYAGVVMLEDLRALLVRQETWEWILASDASHVLEEPPCPGATLGDALSWMESKGLGETPVVEEHTRKVVGLLNRDKALRLMQERWLALHDPNLHPGRKQAG
jgi:solute carrier family 9B (sodium/hydrogen exchanger), member 1/2